MENISPNQIEQKIIKIWLFKQLKVYLVYFCFKQVDKLEESEAARLEEKKEAEYKPVVMGKCLIDCNQCFITYT